MKTSEDPRGLNYRTYLETTNGDDEVILLDAEIYEGNNLVLRTYQKENEIHFAKNEF